MGHDLSPSVSRRTVLRNTAAAAVASLGVHAGSVRAQPPYRLIQVDECTSLSPVSGDIPVEELYHYTASSETHWSAGGPIRQVTAPKTSRILLYEGSEETTSLVIIHGARQENDPEGGGSVTFDIRGLSSDGEWTVRDDFYEGESRFDEWNLDDDRAVIHWTWGAGRTDGAAFRGVGDARIVIDSAFNSNAELYGEHYSGDVERWQAVTGSLDDPEFVDLALDRRVVIESGNC